MTSVNNLFYSIRFQILVAFTLLVLPLIVLSFYTARSQHVFDEAVGKLIEVEDVAHLLSEVEVKVVDLQRNVLIFKETASQLAVNKVETNNQEINASLIRLHDIASVSNYADSINNMQNHLAEFSQNFDLVVGMRHQRTELIRQHTQSPLLESLKHFQSAPRKNVASICFENYLLLAHNASLSYLSSYDQQEYKEFERLLKSARSVLKDASDIENPDRLGEEIDNYEKNFSHIVALIRHYVYLINVVMTGSTNEILYHSKMLDDSFLDIANSTRYRASKIMQQQHFFSNLISVLGFLLAGIVAVFFYLRITSPINRITKVFEKLSEGKKIDGITDIGRKDEIGQLAAAADVFRSKNELTNQLLNQAESMVREQKTLNEELKLQKRRAERALSVKSEFLANMSHELRTPLNSIIGFTVRLLKLLDENDSGRFSKALLAIERNGRHLLAMINDILDLSKIEANKLELRIVPVDISELCASCATQISPVAEEKGLEVVFNPVKLPMVETDPARTNQIVLNLLSNAVKFTESGAVKIEAEVGYGDPSVVVRVTDTGVGMTQEDQKRLFMRFEQFDDNSRFDVGQGTGLGLAIVANISRLLGMTVSVSSVYGRGSTFSVKIPLKFVGEQYEQAT